MPTVTWVEAQTHFGPLRDSARREPVAIIRRGRSAACIISSQEMDELLGDQVCRRVLQL